MPKRNRRHKSTPEPDEMPDLPAVQLHIPEDQAPEPTETHIPTVTLSMFTLQGVIDRIQETDKDIEHLQTRLRALRATRDELVTIVRGVLDKIV